MKREKVEKTVHHLDSSSCFFSFLERQRILYAFMCSSIGLKPPITGAEAQMCCNVGTRFPRYSTFGCNMGIGEPQFDHFGPPLGSLRGIFCHGGVNFGSTRPFLFPCKNSINPCLKRTWADHYSFLGFCWWSFGQLFGDWVEFVARPVEFIHPHLLFLSS
jgi:hypothetical protein